MYVSHIPISYFYVVCPFRVFVVYCSPGPRGPLGQTRSNILAVSRAAPPSQPTLNVVALNRFRPAVSHTHPRLLPCVCQINFESHRRRSDQLQ